MFKNHKMSMESFNVINFKIKAKVGTFDGLHNMPISPSNCFICLIVSLAS